MSKSYELLVDKERYINEIDELIYHTSDEKKVLLEALIKHFQNKNYQRGLDIGPGPGLISLPMYEHCDHLTLLELLPEYESILKQRFPQASVIIDSIETIRFNEKFDIILLAHVIYFFPIAMWPELIKKLLANLTEKGELLIAVWDSAFVYEIFMPKLKGLTSVTPMIISEKFISMLEKFADVSVTKIPVTMQIKDEQQIIQLIAHMCGIEGLEKIRDCKTQLSKFKEYLQNDKGHYILKSNNLLLKLSSNSN